MNDLINIYIFIYRFSIFRTCLYIQPDNIKKQVRNIGNLEKKLANARVAIVFNKTCLNENLLPTFTNIYIYIYIAHRNKNIYICIIVNDEGLP